MARPDAPIMIANCRDLLAVRAMMFKDGEEQNGPIRLPNRLGKPRTVADLYPDRTQKSLAGTRLSGHHFG